jgi:hypothetical protein
MVEKIEVLKKYRDQLEELFKDWDLRATLSINATHIIWSLNYIITKLEREKDYQRDRLIEMIEEKLR